MMGMREGIEAAREGGSLRVVDTISDARPSPADIDPRQRWSDELHDAPPIGRELALAQLLESLKLALSGTGRVCLVTGEAGIGKTRLLQELLVRVQAHECHTLSGRAQDYDHGVAYASLRDLLATALTEEFTDASRADLSQLVRALDAAVFDERGDPNRNVQRQPAYLLATKFLSDLCLSRPTVVVLDDAHLADDETLTALSLAARHLASLPLLLVFSARRDQWIPGSSFAETIGRVIDSGLGNVIDLDPLDVDDTTALIASALSGRPDERLTSYVYSQSRGNPLFAREALRSLKETGAVRREHGKYYLVGNPASGTLTGRAALLHRVFQQDRSGRELARVMSAFRRVHVDQVGALEGITGMDQSRIEQAFDALTKASIISKVSTGRYEFTHPLMAEVLYNDLGPLERRRLHKLIAESFSQDRLTEPTEVLEWTTHVAEAATPGDSTAIKAVLQAASLTRNSAPLSAATWYERALDLLPPEAPERPELLSLQAVALWKGSRPAAAIEVGNRALEALPSGPSRTRTLATVINANYAMGRYADALGLVNAELHSVGDPAPFLAQQALLLAHTGKQNEAAIHSERAETCAGTGSVGAQAVTFSYLGHVANCLGDYPRVRLAVERLVGMGDDVATGLAPGARLSALESGAYLLAITGCLEESRELLEKVTDLLPETGWQDVGGQNIYTKARIEHMSGDWTSALETIRAGSISLEFAGRNNLAWLRLIEAEILTDQAQLDEATKIVEAPMLSSECVLYELSRQSRAARIAMAVGDYEEAERTLLREIVVARETGLADAYRQSLEALVEVHIQTDRRQIAATYARELRELAARVNSPVNLLAADLADTSLGDIAVGNRLVETCESERRLFLAAQAHLQLGSIPSDPEFHLTRALELFTSMGALLWTRRTTVRAKELGLTIASTRRSQSDRTGGRRPTLTQTEEQLVELLRQGLTNRQIAAVLHYSAKTIEVYLSRLYQKVGCHSRLELVVAAERGELSEFGNIEALQGQ